MERKLPDFPKVVSLTVTNRCNLRCRFCHIQEERIVEQDTEGMKRIVLPGEADVTEFLEKLIGIGSIEEIVKK